jgi:hypothetical protein
VFYGPIPTTGLTLSASPTTVYANGSGAYPRTSTVTATVKDSEGNLVLSPTTVTFGSLPGFNGTLSPTTCSTGTTGSCTVTYTAPLAVPISGGNITISASIPAPSTATTQITVLKKPNPDYSNIIVTKTVDGPAKAAGYVPGGKFSITVACPGATPPSTTLLLADGESNDAVSSAYPPVIAPVGDVCTISETVPTGVINANHTNMATYPSTIVVGTNDRYVDVVNTVTSGPTPTWPLTVRKTVGGTTTYHDPNAMFEIEVACTGFSTKTVELMRNESGYIDVPAGVSCSIDEPSPPTALSGYKYLPNIKPSAIPQMTKAETVVVDNIVSNIDPWKVTLTNAVTGLITESGYTAPGLFTVKMVCGVTTYADDAMVEGYPYSYYVPKNANCALTTTASPSLSSDYQWVHTDNLVNPVTSDRNVTVTHDIKGVSDAAYSSLEITQAGPLPTSATAGYTVTVTAKSELGTTLPGTDIVLTVSGGTLATAGTGTFNQATGTCTTGAAGTCVVYWTSTNSSPPTGFTINAKLDGADIGANVPMPPHALDVTTCNGFNTCSPQSRVFYGQPDCTNSELTTSVYELTANGSSDATITATIKDDKGNLVLSPATTVAFSLPTLGHGSLAPTSCSTETTGSCSITYTSPNTIPGGADELIFPVSATGPVCGAIKPVNLKLTSSPNRILTVTKTVNAEAGGYVANGKFAISVDCGGGYAKNMSLANGESDTLVVPLNSTCTLIETAPTPGAGVVNLTFINKATYPATFGVPNHRTVAVVNTVTKNPDPPFTLTVTKTVTGTVAQHDPNAMFAIYVSCDGDGDTKIVNLMRNEIGRVDVNAGSRCTISEPSLAGTPPTPATLSPLTHRYYPNISPEVIAKVDSNRSVEVNNVIDGPGLGKVSLTNAVTGDPTPSAFNNAQNFTVTLGCGTGYNWISAQRVGDVSSYYAPIGNTCNDVTATGRPTTDADYEWKVGETTYNPPSGFAVTAAGVLETVTHKIGKIIGDVSCTTSTLTTSETELVANGASTAIITVTLKDAGGNTVTGSPETVTFKLPTSIYNYGSLSALSCNTGATGSCSVTYTSPDAIPPGDTKATITATLSCGNKTVDVGLKRGNETKQTITVTKTVDDRTGSYTNGKFNVTVACGSVTPLQLAHGEQGAVVVPVGTSCSITEETPSAAVIGAGNTNTAVIAPSRFTVISGEDQTVRITNRITGGTPPPLGTLTISKSVTGTPADMAGHDPAAVFTIIAACGTPTPSASFQLKDNQEATVQGVAGQWCTITEPTRPPALPNYKYEENISPSRAQLQTSGLTVTVENVVYPINTVLYPVTLTNAVTGDQTPSLYNNNGTFTLDIHCGTFRRTPSMRVGDVSTYKVVSGSECTMNTTARPGILDTALWSWGTTTYNPTSPFTVNSNRDEVATHPLQRTQVRPVRVTKTVVDGAGAYTNGAFNITVNCGAGNTRTMSLTGVAGSNTETLNVPVGNTCTVTEAEPGAGVIGAGNSNTVFITPSEFIVRDYNDEINVSVINRISPVPIVKATLKVSKKVTGANKADGHILTNVFTILATCPGLPLATFNLQDGWSGTVQGEVGKVCTITEPAPLPTATAPYHYESNNTGTVTLQADVGTEPGTKVTIENMVTTGTHYPVTVVNAVNGDQTPTVYNHAQPFVLTMDCDAGADYTWDVEALVGETRVFNVPANSRCTMGTTSRPAVTNGLYKWDTVSGIGGTLYNPVSGFQVTAAMTETATHTLILAPSRTIRVVKTVTGMTPAPTNKFTIHVDCGGGQTKTMNLANGENDFILALAGSVCKVTEDPSTSVGAGNSYTAIIAPSEFTVEDDMTVENGDAVRVENRIEVGKTIDKALVTVTKRVNGAMSYHSPTNLFGIHVDCDNTTLTDFNLRAGRSASVEGEVGKVCTITEPTVPTLTSPYKYAPSISPSSSILLAEGLKVTVTNTVTNEDVYPLTLTNAVSGDQTPSILSPTGKFVLALNCGAAPYNFGEVSMLLGAISNYSIPSGRNCNVTMVSRPDPINPDYKWYGEIYDPAVPFTMNRAINEIVTHQLVPSPTRTIYINKTVSDMAGAYAGGKFNVTVTCRTETKDLLLAHGEAGSVQATDGALCTVTEAEPGAGVIGANNHNTFVIAPSSFTVSGRDVYVTITNRIDTDIIEKGRLTVTKTVTGNLAAHDATNVFGIRVACATTPVANFNLMQNQSATVEGELGEICTITETTIPTLTSPYRYAPNISPMETTLKKDQPVTVENMVMDVPPVQVILTNLVDGEATAYDNDGNFTMTFGCGAATTPYNWARDMHVGDKSLFNVPSGWSCTVGTTARPAITDARYVWRTDMTTYSQTNPFTVTADVTDTVTHFIRRDEMRAITVKKTVTGAGYVPGAKFAIRVNCGAGHDEPVNVAHGGSETLWVPLGRSCEITEANPGPSVIGAGNTNTAAIYPSNFVVEDDQDVLVTNQINPRLFPKATVRVTKTISGEDVDIDAGHDPDSVFDIAVLCVTTPPQANVRLKEGQSATVEGEVGSICIVEESSFPPMADPAYRYVRTISPVEMTLQVEGEIIDAFVDNKVIVDPGIEFYEVALTNEVVGSFPTEYNAAGRFKLSLNCTTPSFSCSTGLVREGEKSSCEIPLASTCETIIDSRPSPNAGFWWFKEDYSLGRTFVVPAHKIEGTVKHNLERDVDEEIIINKTLTGDLTLYLGGPFNVMVVCSGGVSKDFSFTFAPGETAKSDTMMAPRGSSCTVTENTDSVILADGTPRRIIAPYMFTVPVGGQTVAVETELLRGPVPRGQLYVTKTVTGDPTAVAAGHNPATVFEIKVTCPDTSPPVKLFSLRDGQSGMADAKIGDTCTISEPTVPMAKFGYEYYQTKEQTATMLAGEVHRTVFNRIDTIGPKAEITFTQATVTDTAGSGYVSGFLNTTVNCGAGQVFNLSLAEGNKRVEVVKSGTVCSSATAGALPSLNSGFRYEGPTTTPPLPYTVNQNGTVTIHYGIRKIDSVPIPTLDSKALLLLIGLLSGLMLWRQSRQPRRQRVDQ